MDIELSKRTFPKTKFSPSTKHCLDKKNLFLKKSENSCFLPKAIICIFYKTGFGYPPIQQLAFSTVALNKLNIIQDVTTVIFWKLVYNIVISNEQFETISIFLPLVDKFEYS